MIDLETIRNGIIEVQRQMLVGCTDTIIGQGSCKCCMAFRCIDALWQAAEDIARWEWYDAAPDVVLQFYREALMRGTHG